MTMKRALLSLAVVLVLPNPAAAQRFAGVMDASGMIARPTVSPTVTPIPGLPTMLAAGTVLIPPERGGFFTPGAVPQPVRADTAALNFVVQPVFFPAPMTVAPSEVIEEEPLDAEALAAARSDARMLSPRRSTSAAGFQARGTTVFAPAVAEPTTGSAIGRCQTAALRQLRASNVQADDLRFGANSTALSTLSDGAEVRGGGILLDADRAQWRRFSYVCDYRGPTAQTRAVVRLEPAR
jgi:hypothetical protein